MLARGVVQDETGVNIIRFVPQKVMGYHMEKDALEKSKRLSARSVRAKVMVTSLFLFLLLFLLLPLLLPCGTFNKSTCSLICSFFLYGTYSHLAPPPFFFFFLPTNCFTNIYSHFFLALPFVDKHTYTYIATLFPFLLWVQLLLWSLITSLKKPKYCAVALYTSKMY